MQLRTIGLVVTTVLIFGCDYDLNQIPRPVPPGDAGGAADADAGPDSKPDAPAADMLGKDLPPKDLPKDQDQGPDAAPTGPGCKTAKHCSAGKWCWDNPFPVGDRIHAIWGSGPTDVFFVGALGMVRHYDGKQWTTERPVKLDLYGVWGNSPTEVYAVGAKGTVLRYDGVYWKAQGAKTTMDLYGIWGDSSSNVWAVGQSNTVIRHDGTKWDSATGPCTAQKDKDLRGVWGSDATNVYVAGCGTMASRWNGSAWKLEHQAGADLQTVWGNSATEVYFAGVGGTVLHYDGSSTWILQSKPSGFSQTLHGVWGSGTHTWSVGTAAAVLKRSGSTWVKDASTGKGSGIFDTNHLYAVWGSSATSVYAAGRGGVVLHYDGKQWRGLVSGATPDLADVWGGGATDILAVGEGGHILRFDGKQWSDTTTPTTEDLNGVWGAGASARYIVGDNKTVLQWEAKAGKWTLLAAPTSTQAKHLQSVWGHSATDVYMAYRWGDLLRFNGANWTHDKTMLSTISGVALDIWGTSATDIYVVGQSYISGNVNGIGAHNSGGGWAKLNKSITNAGSKAWMASVWVAPNGYAFISAGEGRVIRCKGTGKASCTDWQPTKNDLYGVWGRSSLDVFAVGDRGTILHFNGGTWTAQASGTVHDLRGVWGDGKQVLAVGKDGTILRRCP